ncbi:MAG: glutaredoxin domain-containing protein [Verrucomicrobiota bacterium]|nr:glutaredoxin domain-containing protein [Verrucomicrobiota bacterium]
MSEKPVIYIKPGCPWCHEALEFLDDNGIEYRKVDVTSDPKHMEEMVKLSGQSKAPTMQWTDGAILADFGVAELEPFLEERDAL